MTTAGTGPTPTTGRPCSAHGANGVGGSAGKVHHVDRHRVHQREIKLRAAGRSDGEARRSGDDVIQIVIDFPAGWPRRLAVAVEGWAERLNSSSQIVDQVIGRQVVLGSRRRRADVRIDHLLNHLRPKSLIWTGPLILQHPKIEHLVEFQVKSGSLLVAKLMDRPIPLFFPVFFHLFRSLFRSIAREIIVQSELSSIPASAWHLASVGRRLLSEVSALCQLAAPGPREIPTLSD